MIRHAVKILAVGAVISAFFLLDGPHDEYKQLAIDIGIFSGYWILLGVASSIGLGSGLHTFVLYLGPHIAKVTMAAN